MAGQFGGQGTFKSEMVILLINEHDNQVLGVKIPATFKQT